MTFRCPEFGAHCFVLCPEVGLGFPILRCPEVGLRCALLGFFGSDLFFFRCPEVELGFTFFCDFVLFCIVAAAAAPLVFCRCGRRTREFLNRPLDTRERTFFCSGASLSHWEERAVREKARRIFLGVLIVMGG